ncbi:hypothetical protein K431DRAFT_246734 [Polychaeton citri CBS 116435]|uniref:Spindle pole body component n=1 Tax=Polychaeton citri CBS 116435 TaxID=1314669 RepID=A0A9P4Q6K2_9PEZI|nr:hypothetical protein K431DRAFT_246734 [Polychaeton citri CBS 116435]
MLHEVLLALSGHPSPLFTQDDATDPGFPLSPSEQALLQSLGRLADLHRKLQGHASWLADHHQSTICRAVATSIRETHLDRFRRKILDVESRILTKDSSIVGAYEIVPLAGLAAEFEQWHRRMEWYWRTACFAAEPGDPEPKRHASGAALIDHLRAEALTGFPDIEQTAVELSKVAETAWLRQLSFWVVYGKLPQFGAVDFFVKTASDLKDEPLSFRRDRSLLPKFVSPSIASSILFVGKCLHQLREYGCQNTTAPHPLQGSSATSQLAASHLKQLSSLSLPINTTHLSRSIASIRLSLSKNVLQHLLPLDLVAVLFSSLREYFLLHNGEFTIGLITEAENRLQARWQSMGRLLQQDPVKALRGLSMNDAELGQALGQTWKRLASIDEEAEDGVLEFARKHMRLGASKNAASRPSSSSDSFSEAGPQISPVAFNDLLFPSVTALTMSIPSPLDLVISTKDVDTYTTMNSYLLAMRRSHLRLSDLWRKTIARRDHPAPPPQSSSNTEIGRRKLTEVRHRSQRRAMASRKIWATCSAAVFLLAETTAYFETEIIQGSWEHFDNWLKCGVQSDNGSSLNDTSPGVPSPTDDITNHDPETIASAHRAFISALTYALLLTDQPYTKEMRSLLGSVDHLIAFFNRTLEVQQKLDVEYDSNFGLESSQSLDEEKKVSLELDRARKRVDTDLRSVIQRLRIIDQQRLGSARFWHGDTSGGLDPDAFVPWKGAGGVDRLLMKLEFGRVGGVEGHHII